MNNKIKKILISFILMLVFNLGSYYLINGQNFAEGVSLHVGLLLISGLILGPYGAIGSVIGNGLCDLIRGYSPSSTLLSVIISFGISYLGYKLWYGTYKQRADVTNPKLNNTNNVILFLSIVLVCGILYSVLHGLLFCLVFPEISLYAIIEMRYFLYFINTSFIFGIIGIWISNKKNFFHIPKVSKNKVNEKLYHTIGCLLIISIVLTLIVNHFIQLNRYVMMIELMVIILLLYFYLKKPIKSNIIINSSKSILEDVMNIFHLTTLFIVIIGILLSYDHLLLTAIDQLLPLNKNEIMISIMILIDILLIIFFIPSIAVLKYIEMKVIKPTLSFSKIEKFIHKNEKIESDRLVDIYSEYINEKNEIGTLARAYTDLINFNNSYIENIQEIEGEKERIRAELYIANRIQEANLPIGAISNDNYVVNGYSKPAKEVGGDFYDYFEIDDDNLAIVIGDASGKGIPAAILAMITQIMIKQLFKHELNPNKILYLLNNQLCENNYESMFITLWLGIYNKNTNKLTFSNAGHNPPLIKENDKFKYLSCDTGIVLGVVEDFEFVKEELTLSNQIVLYTDGITDANKINNEMYGEDRLLKFFNEYKSEKNPINPLLKNISEFTQGAEQFDDMTLLYLKIKND